MTTELKQAAQQAIDAFDAFGDADDFASLFELTRKMRALRSAIQQAEAQQPATGEPVAWPLRARVWKRESTQEWVLEIAGTLGDTDMNIRHTQPLSVAYENVPGLPALYTRPAPSGLGDSKRLDYLQDRGATIDLIAGVAAFYPMRFRVGGLHSSANIDVRAAIDAAMLAAK